jgi:hypothetical protein
MPIQIGSNPNEPLSRSTELSTVDIGAAYEHTHIENDVINLDKYTKAEVDAKIVAAGGGDLLSTNNLSDVANAGTSRTNLDVYSQAEVDALIAAISGGVTDHGALNGLGDDDHPQYLKNINAENIGDLTDVNLSGLSTLDIFHFNGGTGNWDVVDPLTLFAALVHTHVEADITDLGSYLLNITGENIGSLNDVNLSGLGADDVLRFNNGTGDWEVSDLSDFAPVSHTHTESDITDLGTYLTDITGESIGDVSDVNLTGLADDDVLKYNSATADFEPYDIITYIGAEIAAQVSSVTTGIIVIRDELVYTSETEVSIVTIPAGGVVWDIRMHIDTVFNDAGADLLYIGKDANKDFYVGDAGPNTSDILRATGWHDIKDETASLPDTPFAGSTEINARYDGGAGNATTGHGYIYVWYSTF